MIVLRPAQMAALRQQVLAQFPARILAHWQAQHPRLVACFSAEELNKITDRVIEHGTAQADHTEASIALSADLWLHELARRRHYRPTVAPPI